MFSLMCFKIGELETKFLTKPIYVQLCSQIAVQFALVDLFLVLVQWKREIHFIDFLLKHDVVFFYTLQCSIFLVFLEALPNLPDTRKGPRPKLRH